jgi:hypothetical protein
LQEIAAEKEITIPTPRKGAMDEMMADLSSVVNQILQDGTETADSANKDEKNYQTAFVFGESACPTKLVEDQTGQTTFVSFHKNETSQDSWSRNLPLYRRNVHEEYGIEQDR